MSNVIRVALSGGPCSGKTTCIDNIKSYYEKAGVPVLVCQESASEVIANGVSRDNMLEFETAVALHQIELEKDIDSQLCDISADKVLIIYDRGLTDCFGYVDDESALSTNVGVNRIESWSRYDAVMILENANDYKLSDVRIESEELAREYAESVLSAWMGHPHLRYVRANADFDKKVADIIGEIDCLVNEIEQEKKYLIALPSLDSLAKYSPFKSDIEQTYLLSAVGSHRVRKRTALGVDTCFETIKIRLSDAVSSEIERVISLEEYDELMLRADPKRCTIYKARYCFLYEGQYFELDVFPFWSDRAFLELELRNENQEIILPPEIDVIKDVSEDRRYKNNNLAKLLYKEQHKDESD